MTSVDFPESNCTFGPPSDLEESQCMRIHGYRGEVQQGSVDGVPIIIVAWKPSKEDLEELNNGKPLFLSFLGGIPPHFVTTDFRYANSPA